MSKLKRITEDFSVLQQEAKTSDLIDRVVSRVLRPKSKKLEPISPEKRSKQLNKIRLGKNKRARLERLQREKEGICTRCAKVPPIEGGKTCQKCRYKSINYKNDSKDRKGYYD